MPRNRKKKNTTSQSSEVLTPTCITLPPVVVPSAVASSTVDCSDSSSMAVYPSVYRSGFTDRPPYGPKETFTSIACQAEYAHLSPEEMRFLDLEINTDPARLDPLSFEEARLRHYLPQFDPPTPAPAFSVSSRATSTPSDAGAAVPDLGLVCPAPGSTVDGVSATSTCSLCAARLETDAQDSEEYDATSEGLSREKPPPSLSRHSDQKKRNRMSRRVRRLEKTVESLSHGLILALTELKELRDRSTSAGGRKTDDSGVVDALNTAFSNLSTAVDHSDNTLGTSAPAASHPHPQEQPDPTTQCESATQHTNAKVTALSVSGEPSSVVGHNATEKDSSLFISDDRSPISGLLRPILDFMSCPEVFRFLKWAEAHAGLRSTQLFDLFWVSDNLFNVHGGILIYCLQKSLVTMDAISGVPGSSVWSQDPELMQRLDATYCKQLRSHVHTDGSRRSVTKMAWELYCVELGCIFEQFPAMVSATSFFQKLSEEYSGYLSPIITSSYIEDLSALWTQVHPALLEVTRWLEPFIDYGPDYNRATPLHDATIALRRHAREMYSRRGVESLETSIVREEGLMRLLRENRSGRLTKMQREMEFVMRDAVSRNCDPAPTEVATLVDRAKQGTFWRITEPQVEDALALREVRVMTSYRPRLLRAGTAAARIRSDVFSVLVQTGRAEGRRIGEREVFWDGIGSPL